MRNTQSLEGCSHIQRIHLRKGWCLRTHYLLLDGDVGGAGDAGGDAGGGAGAVDSDQSSMPHCFPGGLHSPELQHLNHDQSRILPWVWGHQGGTSGYTCSGNFPSYLQLGV